MSKTTRLLTMSFVVLLSLLSFSARAEYQPWSPKVFAHINHKYGADAEQRMRKLQRFIAINYDKPIQEKLSNTNSMLNHLPWITDQAKYQQNDYWATPLETIATFGGDCEDIAISKFVVLRNMGVPTEHLTLAYVKIKRTGESHMVLLYIIDPQAPTSQQSSLVLDNYDKQIKTGEERQDIIAIYSVSANNDIVLISDDGRGNRTILKEIEDVKFAKLDKIRAQILSNQTFYQNLNDGIPLF